MHEFVDLIRCNFSIEPCIIVVEKCVENLVALRVGPLDPKSSHSGLEICKLKDPLVVGEGCKVGLGQRLFQKQTLRNLVSEVVINEFAEARWLEPVLRGCYCAYLWHVRHHRVCVDWLRLWYRLFMNTFFVGVSSEIAAHADVGDV
jgi:hypothetical protein